MARIEDKLQIMRTSDSRPSMAAFARMHSSRVQVDIEGHSRLELRSVWKLQVRARASLADLVLPFFRSSAYTVTPREVATKSTGEAAAQGVPMILADEFQFITQSDANVLMAKLLLQLTRIGPPLAYACNYSMVQRLMARPQQERDRLLAAPIVILPEPIGPDWTSIITEFKKTAREFSRLDVVVDGAVLHQLTFGIERALLSLLVLAYLVMRRERMEFVTCDHIRSAYSSAAFASMRQDVERIAAASINPATARRDLACPADWDREPSGQRTVVQHPSIDEQRSRAAQAAAESLVSPEAQEILRSLANSGALTKKGKPRATRPAATAKNLIGGAERFAKDSIPKGKS